jgi:hypothetical protein
MSIKIEQSSGKINSTGGLILISRPLDKIKFSKHIKKSLKRINKRSDAILSSDILLSYIGLLCMGSTAFEDIEEYRNNLTFKYLLGIKKVPSAETLRQRLDELTLLPEVFEILLEMNLLLIREVVLKKTSVTGMNLIVLDMDASPMDNSGSSKEKVSNTYKNFMGYCPVFAYISENGYMLNCNLRPGKDHSMEGALDFIKKCLEITDRLGITDKILFSLDSGYDEADLIKVINDRCYYIIKRNIRQESKEYWLDHAKSNCSWNKIRDGKFRYTGFVEHIRPAQREDIENINVVIEAFETTVDREGQRLLFSEIYINTFWTNLPLEAEEVIELYHNHGTSERYHSELKPDMDVERLPSGKFVTNSLVLQLAKTAYNLLRRISIDVVEFEKVKASRRRIRTVLFKVIYSACKYAFTGNHYELKFEVDNKYYRPITILYARYA